MALVKEAGLAAPGKHAYAHPRTSVKHTPLPFTPFHTLQRTYGNSALAAADVAATDSATDARTAPLVVQPSLLLGPVDTRAERAADAVAASLPDTQTKSDAQASSAQLDAIVQRAASVASLGGGMAVQPALAARIEAARGGGVELDPVVQRTMEQHIGSDLGNVRVHTGGESDSLNRSLQARAFTTGRDIFFRSGEYQPASDGGRRLLAHELTHVVQQGHAPTASGVQRQGIIQRAVGFEFEAGMWTLYKLNSSLTRRQKAGKDQVPTTQLVPYGIPKGMSLHKGKDWDFTADHSDDMHVEFVTKAPGFQEGKDGREKLTKAMADMEKFGDKMVDLKSKAKVKVQGGMDSVPLNKLKKGASSKILLTPRSYLDAEPQTTAGIRLSQLATMFDNFSKQKFKGESDQEAQDRAMGNQVLWGKQPRDQITVAESPDAVYQAWNDILLKYKGIDVKGFDRWPDITEITVGLASMLRSYLITADNGIAYAKSLAPLMARTDLATMFAMLPDDERTFFEAVPHIFVELVLRASDMKGTNDTPVLSGKATMVDDDDLDVLRMVTRGMWLKELVEGVDLMTVKDFPYEDIDQLLFGMGGLGDKMDAVGGDGPNQYNAPIFEFRRMQERLQHFAWPAMAEDVFDFISLVNQGTGMAFNSDRTRAAKDSGGV